MKKEIKYQVFTIQRKERITHTCWRYEFLEEAEEQYKICSEKGVMKANGTSLVELQQVIVLNKEE